MAASDYVVVLISLSKQPLSRAGFGVPLILAADCPVGFTQRVRVYNSPDALITDGFSATGPTYLMAVVLMSQQNAPPAFKVGRQALKPTQTFVLTPTAQDNTEYAGTFNGSRWTYTSGSGATATSVTTGVKAAIATLVTAQSRSIVASGTTAATYTQTGAGGTFDSFSVENVNVMDLAQTHADPGVATDLLAINTEDSDWYGILNPFGSKAMNLAAAVWTETQAGLKQLFADTCDSQHCTVAVGSATDLGTAVQSAAYNYTCVFYSPATSDFLAAAMAGLALPQDPGSENWAMATPTIVAAKLTATHRTNLLAKYTTFCELLGGQNNTLEGKVGSGQYIDTIRLRAWIQVNVQADVITAAKARSPLKLPMTDDGGAVLGAAILGVLLRGENAGGLVKGSSSVFVPKASSISSIDRAARNYSGITFTAQLAGAINKATPIKGMLTA